MADISNILSKIENYKAQAAERAEQERNGRSAQKIKERRKENPDYARPERERKKK